MVSSVEHISEQIFKIIKGFGHDIVLFTDDGKKTTDPEQARRFYAKDIQMMVNFVVDETTSEMVVNLSQDTDVDTVKPMLSSLRNLANRYIVEYTVKTFGKSISPKDFAFMAKNKVNESVNVKSLQLNKTGSSEGEYDTMYEFDVYLDGEKVGEIETGEFGDIHGHIFNKTLPGSIHRGENVRKSLIKFLSGPKGSRWMANIDKYRGLDRPTNDYRLKSNKVAEARGISHRTGDKASAALYGQSKGLSAAEKAKYQKQLDQVAAEIERLDNKPDSLTGKYAKQYDRLEKKKTRLLTKLSEGNNMDVNEGFSGWSGSARKSVNELGDAKMIVRHKRNVDEEKRGARTRQIESIYIENHDGERFKFPSNNITAAKAMTRHVKEGGTPYDDFGQYIYETMDELNQLKVFQRKNKRNDFFEDAAIGEEIGARITKLRENLKKIAGVKGYAAQFESFKRESADISKEKLDELKDSVTVRSFDESITDSLPYVVRVIENLRGRQAREAGIVDFAKYVMGNKDSIQLTTPIDGDDPENPGARKFSDPATAIAAWVNYLAPKVKDDSLSNKMMEVGNTVHEVGQQHLNMAAAAINVIRQKGKVAEASDIGEEKVAVDEAEIAKINESFAKYNVRKIFGA